MKSEAAPIAAALAMALAGCVFHAKPKVVSQPAQLSVPQTAVTLPPPQPLDPEALVTEAEDDDATAVPAAPAPAAPAPLPAAPVRRPAPKPAQQVEARIAPPVVAQPAPPPEERPAIQAILPAQEQKRLRESAQQRKKVVRATLAKMSGRRLSAADEDLVKRIQFFLTESDKAERSGDMSQADAFAQRAQDLARPWQGGK